MEDLTEVKVDVKEIKKMLLGNGKVGVSEMARRAFDYTQWHKASKNGLLDWVFRIGIAIIVGFIAVKVGLK